MPVLTFFTTEWTFIIQDHFLALRVALIARNVLRLVRLLWPNFSSGEPLVRLDFV